MTLRRIIALVFLVTGLYFGGRGVALLAGGADGYASLAALICCGWGICSLLVAVGLGFGKSRKPRRLPAKTSRAHDIAIGLFAGVFGFACLYLAARGLFTGAIAGLSSRNADVVFSAGAGPFLFLLLVWTGMGSGLVYLAIRLFRGEQTG